MEQNNNGKELAKLGAKAMLKVATAPLKTLVITAIGTILPYILIAAVIFIVILCVYFGTMEQIDEVLDGSTDWGERMGNAVSLYGFKTNEELEEDEEGKYFEMLYLYQKLFGFSNYELSIINQTLLYEGSNEERVYLSERPENYENKKADNSNISVGIKDDEGNIVDNMTFWAFIKNIFTNYQRGFFSTYGGQSQYVKANKNLLINAAALKKCAILAGKDTPEEKQCYKGYLVAEYNIVTDYFIDCYYDGGRKCNMAEPIETDVEAGYLVYPNNIVGKTAGISNEIYDLVSSINSYLASFTVFGGAYERLNKFFEVGNDALTLFAIGTLATEDSHHFYYDGYIVNNLKEHYKLRKDEDYDNETLSFDKLIEFYDKERIEKERKNRRKTAVDIINMVDSYFELTYGKDKIEKQFAEIVASNESKASVVIDEDGNSISFDDYVLIYALAKYSDEIKAIVDSGENVDERLRALMIVVRTQIYNETGFNHSSSEVIGNNDIYEMGKEIYDSFKADTKLYKYLASLSASIANSRGRTIKVNGQVVNLTSEQINEILGAVENGGKIDDIIDAVIPDASLNVTFSPLPEGSFHISSEYGEVRGDEQHNAIDYAAPQGTSIYSISDGVVTDVLNGCTVGDISCGGGFGNRVYVRYNTGDGHDYYVIYAHMTSTANVSVGQTISAGTLIGYVGNTGYSFGNHLHLEVRKDNTSSSEYAINPALLFDMNFGG